MAQMKYTVVPYYLKGDDLLNDVNHRAWPIRSYLIIKSSASSGISGPAVTYLSKVRCGLLS